MNADNRKSPRIDRTRRAVVEMAADMRFEAEVVDVSKNGVGLLCPRPCEPGATITVTVQFERGTEYGSSITVNGHVTSCGASAGDDRFRIGVGLGKLSLHEAQVWHDMVQRSRAFVV